MYESFYLNSFLGYVKNLYGLSRNIKFADISRSAAAGTDGDQLNAAAETGYDFRWGTLTITPRASLHYITLTSQGFTENGAGVLDLSVPRQSAASLQTSLGGRLAWQAQVGSVSLIPQFYASWQHEFADDSRGLSASLAMGGPHFLFQTLAPQRDFALLGVECGARLGKRFTARVGYSAEVGRGSNVYQGVTAGVRLEF
jgi:outer membrane autotransporter protein